jgi:hypothetical protein
MSFLRGIGSTLFFPFALSLCDGALKGHGFSRAAGFVGVLKGHGFSRAAGNLIDWWL